MASFTHYRVNGDNLHPVLEGTKEPEGTFLDDLLKRLKINTISLNDDDVVFDLIGVDASIANALRRIMLAEVQHLDSNFPSHHSQANLILTDICDPPILFSFSRFPQ